MSLIATLQNLEPTFIQAGQLAYKMQKGVGQRSKFNTGNNDVDVVTEADLAVQEFLLQEIIKTELIDCRLLAEEDTPLAKKFNDQGKYYLVLDPIDGTAIYARGGLDFSVIVSLHDGQKPLYTFVHYPALNWTHRIVNNEYSVSGTPPVFHLSPEAPKSIVYYAGNPEQTIPELYHKLKSRGINFVKPPTISQGVGALAMFACDKVAGVYEEDINVYDGLAEFHLALAKGLRIYSGGPGGALDLSNVKERECGLYYPGYYLALTSLHK